jgi:hypothetical protein
MIVRKNRYCPWFVTKYLLKNHHCKAYTNLLSLFTTLFFNAKQFIPFNPISTGQGQSWPCQLRRQIPGIIHNNVLFFIWPIPADTSPKSFWTSDMTSKNDVLTSILTIFRQNFCRVTTLPPSQFPTGFTPITDHPSAGEVPPGRGPQCGAAPVKFQSVSCPRPLRVRGEAGSQSGRILMLPHHSGQITKTTALYTYASKTGRGEFTSHESEVKTEGTPVV